jgi:predicted nucleic acid-binding protein
VTFVDTNVLLDVITDDPQWCSWSLRHLDMVASQGDVLINDVVYAELSVGYQRIEDLDELLEVTRVEIAAMPRTALFLAEKVFQRYKSAGGRETGVLPDFFIGAHASILGLPLLTRDARRFRTYFSSLTLIRPDPI